MNEKQEQGDGQKTGDQKEPTGPRDPKDRTEGGKPETPEASDPQQEGAPGWVAALPPEYRDAASVGDWAKIPERYRETVKRYLLWLAKQKTNR